MMQAGQGRRATDLDLVKEPLLIVLEEWVLEFPSLFAVSRSVFLCLVFEFWGLFEKRRCRVAEEGLWLQVSKMNNVRGGGKN